MFFIDSPWLSGQRQLCWSPGDFVKVWFFRKFLRPAVLTYFFCGIITAHSAVFNVNKVEDSADGRCDEDCSLREAVVAANANAGTDIINLPAGHFRLAIPGGNEDGSLTGDLDLSDDTTLLGAGPELSIIDGGSIDRVVDVFDGTDLGPEVTIQALTITGGTRGTGRTSRCGGGIWSRGDLRLVNVAVIKNDATSGGGLCNRGRARLDDVTMDSNRADLWGGAIDNVFGVLRIFNSTLSNNSAGREGGAVSNDTADFKAKNSTFFGNRARRGSVLWSNDRADLDYSTIVANGSKNHQTAVYIDAGTLSIRGSILENLPGASCNTPVGVYSQGHNLESGSSCGLHAVGDRDNIDPQLGKPAKNGGPTLTLAPLVTSPVIEAGPDVGCPSIDQRGERRPQDGNLDGLVTCDIGAVEVLPVPTTLAAFPLAESGSLVIVGELNGAGQATVKYVDTMSLVRRINFTQGLSPTDADAVVDLNSDGTDDIALLAYQDQEVRPRLEIRDPLTGTRIGHVNFRRQHRPIALSILPDQNGNQSQEAAALVRRLSDDRARIFVHDLATKEFISVLKPPANFEALNLAATPDFDGNGAAELLVLARRRTDARGFILVLDTGGSGQIGKIALPANHKPTDLQYLPGPDGRSAFAVLAERLSDQRGRVLAYDASTGLKLWGALLATGDTPIGIQAFAASAGNGRLAILQWQRDDDRPIVRMLDTQTGNLINNVTYVRGQQPLLLVVIPDTALDLNREPELGVVVDSIAGTFIRVRDSVTQELIQSLRVP